jgi:hypothetical protein
MNLEIQFANAAQRAFYFATQRSQCYSGGFNNGKTYAGCLKAFTLLTTFNNYRMAIARQVFADLKKTTMQTFFKLCPSELIERHNEQDGLTILKNKSVIYWLHLDNVDEGTLRGLEINSALVDQAEEMEEKVYDVLDGRIARWDNAEVSPELIKKFNGQWPQNRGKPVVPSYLMLLCNPETQFHFIYRKYHPDSLERNPDYFFVEGAWDPSLGSSETYQSALSKGDEWVQKYVKGQWGISSAQIHRVWPESLLEYDKDLVDKILRKGNLFRSLDHGETAPTSCLWFAVYNGVYICYREYYVPGQTISYHRKSIFDLSNGEVYSSNYADPQIFKRTAQKQGGFWTIADEYMTSDIDAPPLHWIPADNNEFSTRNRINELLKPSHKYKNPITAESAPGLYFIKRSQEYPHGCYNVIKELQSQRHKMLGYIDGRAVYTDDREESVSDHSYDALRYFVAMHGRGQRPPERKPPPHSFKWYQHLKKRAENVLAAGSV